MHGGHRVKLEETYDREWKRHMKEGDAGYG